MNIKLKTRIYEKYRYQGDLARKVGISEDALSRIIHERRTPWPDEKQAIAEALGCTPEELFGE
jgi:transcriptional regulator with XRE-family HTH domain